MESQTQAIIDSPKYKKLVSTRNRFAWLMTFLMMFAYYGFILLVAFNKELLGQKLGAGMVTSVGIPLGLGVLVFTIIITNIYVRRANSEFDTLTAEVLAETK